MGRWVDSLEGWDLGIRAGDRGAGVLCVNP